MTRRSLIRRALQILGIGFVGPIGCVSRRGANGTSPSLEAAVDPAAKFVPLSTAEVDDLVALGEVLVQDRMLTPGERRYLVEHIEGRTRRNPGYVPLYRLAAGTLNRLGGRRFAQLEVRDRIDLIVRYRLTAPMEDRGRDPGPLPADMRALRTQAIPDLIRGYYASAAGWAVVGYGTFPGRCGDLARYTRPEG